MAVMLEVSKKKLKARGRFSYLSTVPAYNRSVHIPIMTLGRLTKSGKVGIGFLCQQRESKMIEI